MKSLLDLSRAIDRFNGWIGRSVSWLVVAVVVVSSGNAIVRKLFDVSSNAWLEIQWWIFALVFLLAAPWTLRDNGHVRVDVLNHTFSKRTRDILEVVGHVFFLVPMVLMIIWTSSHYATVSFFQNEQSKDAGGLPQWPIKMLIPIAFSLLLVQGVSELIKRVAIMRGDLSESGAGHGYRQTVMDSAQERGGQSSSSSSS